MVLFAIVIAEKIPGSERFRISSALTPNPFPFILQMWGLIFYTFSFALIWWWRYKNVDLGSRGVKTSHLGFWKENLFRKKLLHTICPLRQGASSAFQSSFRSRKMDERATRLNERTRLLQMEQEEEEDDEFWREERTKDYAILVFILLVGAFVFYGIVKIMLTPQDPLYS